MNNTRWMLPEGVDELLPPDSFRLERLRRTLLDLHHSWGYALVIPPFVEYLDSLLVGTGSELDVQTFKIIDQLNGKSMGMRADMTPQVARIDAHQLRTDAPVRLCYIGTVLRTLPDGFAGGRTPMQFGAEIYGHDGLESDAEILSLCAETMATAGVDQIHLDLGHVGIYRALVSAAALSEANQARLFDLLQRKARPELAQLVASIDIDAEIGAMLCAIADLNGGREVLAKARQELESAPVAVLEAIDYLEKLADALTQRSIDVSLHFDLAELRGYQYHTGLVFAVYRSGLGQEIARGGRYNDIGAAFGRSRPATGFSTDLRILNQLAQGFEDDDNEGAIYAPHELSNHADFWECVAVHRAAGECVVIGLQGQTASDQLIPCDRQLTHREGEWQLVELADT